MNKSRLLGAVCACFALLGISSPTNASLIGRDLDGVLNTAEAYYDTAQNITWLADAGYAGGPMYWSVATNWANTLNPYDSGITGWRLPNTVDVGNDGATYTNFYQGVDYGYNITAHSEMSYMFYAILGNKSYYNTSGNATGCEYCLTNSGPFLNLLPAPYWSGTTYAPDSSNKAWYFYNRTGAQSSDSQNGVLNVWAVHDGDVGAEVVPIPASVWLFSSGLLGLIGMARRQS